MVSRELLFRELSPFSLSTFTTHPTLIKGKHQFAPVCLHVNVSFQNVWLVKVLFFNVFSS
jgi:hypothetical protein